MHTVIAIDGPAASGKSTVARRVAQELGYLYVDSGALYRAVTWVARARGIEGVDTDGVIGAMHGVQFDFHVRDGAVCFTIDGEARVEELRSQDVNDHVSPVAAIPEVRAQIVSWLRSMAQLGPLVMEGRDIGTKVFPATPLKFYLDASPEERARRRHGEVSETLSVAEVDASLKRRDKIDSGRKTDPLKVAENARVIDSTGLSIEAVTDAVLSLVRADGVSNS